VSGWLRAGAAAAEPARWVVLDVEASSLDAGRAQLLAIAAVGVRFAAGRPHVALRDSFEAVLRHAEPAMHKPNILLHGIGVGAQRAGAEPAAALRAFTQWAQDAPLVAFHAAFDRELIVRACDAALGERLRNAWLDVEPIARIAVPDAKARSLDDWLARFGIPVAQRHQAAADTLATAELLLRLWPALVRQVPKPGVRTLRRLSAQQRWIA
jgi:DNA polymerase-3 subunit epsilon